MLEDIHLWLPASLLLLGPLWGLLHRAGLGGPWALLCLIPVYGPPVVILILAFGRWAEDDQAEPPETPAEPLQA